MIEFYYFKSKLLTTKYYIFFKCNILGNLDVYICIYKARKLQREKYKISFLINGISFSSIKFALIWYIIALNLLNQLWSQSGVIKFANLRLVITKHCPRHIHEIRWNKIRFHHVTVMSRCLQTLQITLSEVWWIIPDDMILITLPVWYQSRLHSPLSIRAGKICLHCACSAWSQRVR